MIAKILIFVLTISTSSVYCQVDLKQLIFSDFVLLNEAYNHAFIPEVYTEVIISDQDTMTVERKWSEILNQFEYVTITSVDSFGRIMLVEASFYLLPFHCPAFIAINDLSFTYVIYRGGDDRLLKIDGFMISEALYLPTSELRSINQLYQSISEKQRGEKIRRAIENRHIDQLKELLEVNILKTLKDQGVPINTQPFILDSIIQLQCHTN